MALRLLQIDNELEIRNYNGENAVINPGMVYGNSFNDFDQKSFFRIGVTKTVGLEKV